MGKAIEVDLATGEVIERDMTPDELKAQISIRRSAKEQDDQLESKIAKKLAVYEKLGLTQEEIDSLLA